MDEGNAVEAPLVVFSVVKGNDHVEHYFFSKAEFSHRFDGGVHVNSNREYVLLRSSENVPISDAILTYISHMGEANSQLRKDSVRTHATLQAHERTITQLTDVNQKLRDENETLKKQNQSMKTHIKLSYEAYVQSDEKE